MPKRGRRQTQSAEIGKKRWTIEDFLQMDSSDDDNVIGDEKNIDWTHEDILSHVGDLFQLCNNQCSFRMLSTLLYITLRHFNITWRAIDNFMSAVGGMRCSVDHIEFSDKNGVKQSIHCYIERGSNKNKSKGLLKITKELNVPVPPKCKLDQLCNLLGQHPAFQNVSGLVLRLLRNAYVIVFV
ncbi:unnamed protein product [Didymodactylos carnosus]|uniref:Uncharacterized protein n=1 Tax=Didymodactylos carnosus TaxID=1234261 RepID=A0A816BWB7_9BILA|nr:unnamed protein product [Didymodactylos carnosus]CAF1614301.1 unnamed protein product [Didymodactylos carnosus]CAF4360245.1 unnamed protein product [Didymodactylos carnosus]CAF4499668.1 unnamed protein product [Didymodactylos carnosus]